MLNVVWFNRYSTCLYYRALQVDFARSKTHAAAEFYLTTRVGHFTFVGIAKTLRSIVERYVYYDISLLFNFSYCARFCRSQKDLLIVVGRIDARWH